MWLSQHNDKNVFCMYGTIELLQQVLLSYLRTEHINYTYRFLYFFDLFGDQLIVLFKI